MRARTVITLLLPLTLLMAAGCGKEEEGAPGDRDICAEMGWYSNGLCDRSCLHPDPDCLASGDGGEGDLPPHPDLPPPDAPPRPEAGLPDTGIDADAAPPPDLISPELDDVPADGPVAIALEIRPVGAYLGVGEQASLSLVAELDDGPRVVSAEALWEVSDQGVLSLEGAGSLRGLAPGQAEVTASWGGQSARCTLDVHAREVYEGRGIWVTRWEYGSRQDVVHVMDACAAAGLNIIYWQVRGRGDALYRSTIEPWASELGSLGEDPGWDPLEVALEEAHARKLELHAWINVFTMWSGNRPPPSTDPEQIFNAHPEWRMVDQDGVPMPLGDGYVWMSPGITAVREHNLAVAREILAEYPVDGLHLDRIRYPGRGWSHDQESLDAFEQAQSQEPGLDFAEWRRRAVSEQVRMYHDESSGHDPPLPLSAAVGCNYNNEQGWSSVHVSYTDSFQDSRAWMEQGIIDQVHPMCYWPIRDDYGSRTDFAWLADDLVADALELDYDRHLFIGMLADYDSFTEIEDEIEYTRNNGSHGIVLFSFSGLENMGYVDDLGSGPFARPAVVPFPWYMYWE